MASKDEVAFGVSVATLGSILILIATFLQDTNFFTQKRLYIVGGTFFTFSSAIYFIDLYLPRSVEILSKLKQTHFLSRLSEFCLFVGICVFFIGSLLTIIYLPLIIL